MTSELTHFLSHTINDDLVSSRSWHTPKRRIQAYKNDQEHAKWKLNYAVFAPVVFNSCQMFPCPDIFPTIPLHSVTQTILEDTTRLSSYIHSPPAQVTNALGQILPTCPGFQRTARGSCEPWKWSEVKWLESLGISSSVSESFQPRIKPVSANRQARDMLSRIARPDTFCVSNASRYDMPL